MQKLPRFSNQKEKEFVMSLKQNVNAYFQENNISKHANGAMIFKSVFFLSIWIGSYLLLLFGNFSLGVQYLLWAVLGFGLAMVAVNIGHDAIHGAYSSNRLVNRLLAHTFNFNGASAYMWNRMHNQAHHSFTNIEGLDEDIDPFPILRICSSKDLWPIHRFQHIYAFFFYGLATLSWVFIKDYVKFFKNEVGNYNQEKHPPIEYFYLFFYKFLNYTLFIVLPLLLIDQPWWHVLLGFLLMHYIGGITLALIFMLAHAVEGVHFPHPDQSGKMEHSWIAHQLRTTANFAPQSRLAGFLTGGLNLQVEHHLFPHICSIHYRAISQIVKETAQEFGQPYIEYSFPGAVKSHYKFLKRMGKPEQLPLELSPKT